MIKVNNLTKKFDTFLAVDNISFNVNKGEIFAFLGVLAAVTLLFLGIGSYLFSRIQI